MLNKVQLIGFLGGDPEVRYTNDSEAIARVKVYGSTRLFIMVEPDAQRRNPTTHIESEFSLPWAVACIVIDGRLALFSQIVPSFALLTMIAKIVDAMIEIKSAPLMPRTISTTMAHTISKTPPPMPAISHPRARAWASARAVVSATVSRPISRTARTAYRSSGTEVTIRDGSWGTTGRPWRTKTAPPG